MTTGDRFFGFDLIQRKTLARLLSEVSGGGGDVTWGDITGDLVDQADLDAALGDKADAASLSSVATSGDASDVAFSPDGVPGISATDVQAAIAELAAIVDGLGN